MMLIKKIFKKIDCVSFKKTMFIAVFRAIRKWPVRYLETKNIMQTALHLNYGKSYISVKIYNILYP